MLCPSDVLIPDPIHPLHSQRLSEHLNLCYLQLTFLSFLQWHGFETIQHHISFPSCLCFFNHTTVFSTHSNLVAHASSSPWDCWPYRYLKSSTSLLLFPAVSPFHLGSSHSRMFSVLLQLTSIPFLSRAYLHLSKFSSTCSLVSQQITMSTANIIVHGVTCLTSSVHHHSNKKGLRADPWCSDPCCIPTSTLNSSVTPAAHLTTITTHYQRSSLWPSLYFSNIRWTPGITPFQPWETHVKSVSYLVSSCWICV